MIVAFIIASVCFVGGISATVNALVADTKKQAYREGYRRGVYEASKQQVDTEAFFRGIEKPS